MNDLVKAERINPSGEKKTNGRLIIMAPEESAEIICGEDKITCTDGVIIIPPNGVYEILSCGKGCLSAEIERPITSVNKPAVICGEVGRGIAFAVKQADYFYNCSENAETVLAGLSGLMVSYANYALGKKKYSPVTQRVMDETDRFFTDQSFSAEDCILRLPLNYDYVRKLFKKETGVTPHEYLISKRMERARELLSGRLTNRYSNYSVSQIAELCGFSEPLYFSRVFKKRYGVSPSEYKK